MKTLTKEEWAKLLWKACGPDTLGLPLPEQQRGITVCYDQADAVLAKLAELQGECLWCGEHKNCDSAMHRSCWDALRGRQAKDVADARLQGLVDACKAVCSTCGCHKEIAAHPWWTHKETPDYEPSCHSPVCVHIRRLIAAHHAKHDPKPKPCEHKESLSFDYDVSNLNVPTSVRCLSCGMVRKLGPWEEENAKKS